MISIHKAIEIFERSLNFLKEKSIFEYNLAVNEIENIKKAQIQLYEFTFILYRRDKYLKDIEEINEKIKKITGFSLGGLQ